MSQGTKYWGRCNGSQDSRKATPFNSWAARALPEDFSALRVDPIRRVRYNPALGDRSSFPFRAPYHMTPAYISELARHVGGTVTIRGWVATTRSSGKIAFLVMRDGTGYLQAVLAKKEVPEAVWATFLSLTHETSVAVTGLVREDARAPGGYEL